MKKIAVVIGARPNVPKAWTLLRGIKQWNSVSERKLSVIKIHSGQHYDNGLGEDFAKGLGISIDINLRIGSGENDADQISKAMKSCHDYLEQFNPDGVVVIGDVNTTLAMAIVASRSHRIIIHLEAGLRARINDAEEINRKIITACSSFHLVTGKIAAGNLLAEGIKSENIYIVGNTMAETYLRHHAQRTKSQILGKLGLVPNDYILVTVHKPYSLHNAASVADLLVEISKNKRVVFPCHPHTRKLLVRAYPYLLDYSNIIFEGALGYHDFGRLLQESYCVITDSSGVQEEATVAGIPCIILGVGTARPEVLESGNWIIDPSQMEQCLVLLKGPLQRPTCPDYWDDQVSTRIAEAFQKISIAIYENNKYDLRFDKEDIG